MSTKVKGNNKGFSLVELIVVMAIMAILAVTLAPRLSQYIDKARQSNDREAVNAVYTAIKLGMMDDQIYAIPDATIHPTTGVGAPYVLKLVGGGLYARGGSKNEVWTKVSTGLDLFEQQIVDVLGSFKLQSNLVGAHTEIVITVESATKFKVQLDYDTCDGGSIDTIPLTFVYEVDSSDVAVD